MKPTRRGGSAWRGRVDQYWAGAHTGCGASRPSAGASGPADPREPEQRKKATGAGAPCAVGAGDPELKRRAWGASTRRPAPASAAVACSGKYGSRAAPASRLLVRPAPGRWGRTASRPSPRPPFPPQPAPAQRAAAEQQRAGPVASTRFGRPPYGVVGDPPGRARTSGRARAVSWPPGAVGRHDQRRHPARRRHGGCDRLGPVLRERAGTGRRAHPAPVSGAPVRR
jgi:hypothetical protein